MSRGPEKSLATGVGIVHGHTIMDCIHKNRRRKRHPEMKTAAVEYQCECGETPITVMTTIDGNYEMSTIGRQRRRVNTKNLKL
jgi:hypothetical protein